MKHLIMLFVFAVTVIPILFIALIVSPFGLADDVADGYENWLVEDVCNCKEETK